jgi:hypothetical protein
MGRRQVISDGSNAVEIKTYRTARNGLVADIKKACVAQGGFVRQYWPRTGSTTDERITWTATPITTYNVAFDPNVISADLSLKRLNGIATYDDYPNAPINISYLDPPLDGTAGDDGKYLIKAEQISGDPVTGIPTTYEPGSYTFNGASWFHRPQAGGFAVNSDQLTFVARIKNGGFVGGADQVVTQIAQNRIRLRVICYASDHGDATIRDKVQILIQDGVPNLVGQFLSNVAVCDGQEHILFFAYNAATAAVTFFIDGLNADDLTYPSRVAITGTLEVGTVAMGIGINQGQAGNPWIGDISYVGLSNTYLTNPLDFMDGNKPKELDESTWTEWGAQPVVWSAQGKLTVNQGSGSNFNAVGALVENPAGGDPIWVDLNSQSDFIYSLLQSVIGTSTGLVNVSIAADDGAGAPVAGTTVLKPVTFIATVNASGGGASKIVWTTVQRDLVEIKEGENADCVFSFNPAGYATGDADTSGAFSDDWHEDSPLVTDPENYTVQVNLISGTAPTGSALGVPITGDIGGVWTLATTAPDENLSNELDVIVDDTIISVTKRITMNSQYTVPATTVVWTTTQWNLDDVADDPNFAGVIITVDDDGVVKATYLNKPGSFNEDWHSDAPTPSDTANFEAELHVVSGDPADITGALDEFINLATATGWTIKQKDFAFRNYQLELSIRRIGEIAVTKPITILLSVEGALP